MRLQVMKCRGSEFPKPLGIAQYSEIFAELTDVARTLTDTLKSNDYY